MSTGLPPPTVTETAGFSTLKKKKEKEKVQTRFMFYFPFNYNFVAALPLVEFAFHFPCGAGIYLFRNLLFILKSFLLLKLKGLICKYELNHLLHRLFVLLNGHGSNFLQDYNRYNTNANRTVFVSISLAHPGQHVTIHSDPHGDALSSLRVGPRENWCN